MQINRLLKLFIPIAVTLASVGMLNTCSRDIAQTDPTIVLDPISGGACTSVTVSGSGFPTALPVSIRLGPPSVGATPRSYGDVVTDIDGKFVITFTMPDRWPNGTPIAEDELIVVLLNEDGSVKATAPFEYIRAVPTVTAPTSGQATLVEQP